MPYKTRVILIGVIFAFFASGCDNNKTVEEFNKSAIYWYKKIAQSISRGNLDKADAYYISLKSEHMRSPFMPTAIIMLAHAHMNEEEYQLATFYLDEYSKRYGMSKTREYIEFMKLKAAFMGIKDVYKDQKLIQNTIAEAQAFINRYPGSDYQPLVQTLLIRLHMTQYLLNENIAALYERTGKAEAAKIYRDKNKRSVIKNSDITPPEKGMIGQIFD